MKKSYINASKILMKKKVFIKRGILMIDSPCIGICALHKINNQTLCAGCKRNPNEIRNWMKFSNKEKKEVIKRLKVR